MSDVLFEKLTNSLVDGDPDAATALTQQALAAGLEPMAIIRQGLMPGMDIVGQKFSDGEYFLPDLIIAALSLTTRAFLPVVRHATELARARGDPAPGPYRMDFIGRLLKMSLEPPARVRVKTRAQFTPGNVGAPALVLDEFLRLQDEMIAVVEAADGVRLDVVKVTSPFDTRVRYNLLSAFQVIAAHQRRHLAQARRAAGPTT